MLPQKEWLSAAKRLAVGMTVRITHGRETRQNLVIGNLSDRWYAYCHKCHEGGVVQKDHVLLTADAGPADMEASLPPDIVPVSGSEFETSVARFLATKNMDQHYLPELFYSEKRKRLLIRDADRKWHGRDLTGRSPMKWMNYNNAKLIGRVPADCIGVVVEDAFSLYKTAWALRECKGVYVVCALGTGCSASLVNALMPAESLLWFFDADAAGDVGYTQASQRMRPFMDRQARARPPEGLDPKDMSCEAIRELIIATARGVLK